MLDVTGRTRACRGAIGPGAPGTRVKLPIEIVDDLDAIGQRLGQRPRRGVSPFERDDRGGEGLPDVAAAGAPAASRAFRPSPSTR